MDNLVIASRNEHKIKEIKDILKNTPYNIISIDDLNIDVEVEEDGNTFEENSYKKANEIMKITKMPTIADDSGLEVDALGGRPGVYSARFAAMDEGNTHEIVVKENASSEKNNEKLLKLMGNIPQERRGARFVTVMVVLYPNGDKIVARGEISGYIGYEEKGDGGFGYDPLFIVPEYNKTFAELGSNIKNKISHRAKALENLKNKLENRKAGGNSYCE
jgi:XTP/dITP diphosphohydrolase